MHTFTAIIDSGSTHNFVSVSAPPPPGWPSVPGQPRRPRRRGLMTNVAICIADEYFTVDCYSIPLDCYNIGVAWLGMPGPILWEFDNLCMAFWRHGHHVLLNGIGLMRTDISLMNRLHSTHPAVVRTAELVLLDRLLDPSRTCSPSPQAYLRRSHVITAFILSQVRSRWTLTLTNIPSFIRMNWKDSVTQCFNRVSSDQLSTSPFSAQSCWSGSRMLPGGSMLTTVH